MSGLRYGARLRRGGPTRASGTGMMTAIRSINDKKAILEGRLFVGQESYLQQERDEALPRNSPLTTTESGTSSTSSLFMVASTATTLYLQPAPAPTEHDAMLVLADDAEAEHIGPSLLQPRSR